MNAGKLRHKVEFQEDTGATRPRDGMGEPVERWRTAFEAWAAVEPVSGREYWQARQVQADVTHKVTVRYRAGLSAGMRVKWGGRYLYLTEPPRDLMERHQWLEFFCKEAPEEER